MPKIKVLFLIHTLQVGGAERALVNIVNNLDPKKYDITVMTVVDTGAFRQELAKTIHYKTIIKVPHKKNTSNSTESGNLLQGKKHVKDTLNKLYQSGWRHFDTKKIYKKFIKDRYDVEVAFLEGISTKIIASSTNPNSRKIAWVHVDLLEETKSDNFFKNQTEEKNTYLAFDQIVTVSNTVKAQFEKKFDYDPQKLVVLHNPIDTIQIQDKAAQETINTNIFTLCSIGRLAPQKGYDRLLCAVKKLNADGLKFNLWIIGVGAEEDNLKKYIVSNHLNNVQLLGYKPNPYPYLQAADLYVCSSRAEGFSTTVSESIILGTPVVSTDCSGAKEILGDSEYGIICDNSTDGLYNSIKKILQNKKIHQAYIKQTKERVPSFDMDKSLREIDILLETKI